MANSARRFPIVPAHPERICWGCDRYCAADQMICGNGSVRTPHPAEMFGEDWLQWEAPSAEAGSPAAEATPEATEATA